MSTYDYLGNVKHSLKEESESETWEWEDLINIISLSSDVIIHA